MTTFAGLKTHTAMAYDIKILKDETQDGIRVVYAQPCNEVCSQQIAFAVKDGIILEAAFAGGCSGNTQGICALIRGMRVTDAVARLEGISCGGKGTSCPDQLARALRTVLMEQE